ncbi:hypothetical protein [Oceaniserpentilla sp. 4NH20-0058]|uniref:hypothetical protein n=1 Tax=Oceaniserpentilla sp. 4NH20-0058 TaxID=3127660 RepID=UPI00334239B7
MSAFYMYLLSSEDKRFNQDFNRYFKEATSHISQSSDPVDKQFSQKWQELLPTLKYEQMVGMGASLNENIRGNFRKYAVDLFLEHKNRQKKSLNTVEALGRIQLNTFLLSARALDVDSTIYGTTMFTQHDFLLDQAEVFKQIQLDLEFLQTSKLSEAAFIQLRRIQAKLDFMKSSLIDYNTQSATYLLYQNALSITKIIKKLTSNNV